MIIRKKLPNTEEAIVKECRRLKISFHCSTNSTGLDHSEMQRRILAVWAEERNSSLWLIALISSIASVASAITAIIVVCSK